MFMKKRKVSRNLMLMEEKREMSFKLNNKIL